MKEWSCRKGEHNTILEIHSDGSTHGICADCEYRRKCIEEVRNAMNELIQEYRSRT